MLRECGCPPPTNPTPSTRVAAPLEPYSRRVASSREALYMHMFKLVSFVHSFGRSFLFSRSSLRLLPSFSFVVDCFGSCLVGGLLLI